MRHGVLWSGIGLLVLGCSDTPVDPPPPTRLVTVAQDSDNDGDNQTGVVGYFLALPLRAVVRVDGKREAGVTVGWTASAGTLSSVTSITDIDGLATTTWRLDHVPGPETVTAAVEGATISPVFHATALAGPVMSVVKISGDGQTVSISQPESSPLTVQAKDAFGNEVSGADIEWSVENGLVRLLTATTETDAQGKASALALPVTTVGPVTVSALLSGTLRVDFTINVSPPDGPLVLLEEGRAFLSAQNDTHGPAVDTLAIGQTMTFKCATFDYEVHRLGSLGQPSFDTQEFPYSCNATPLTVTFTEAGTYRYADLAFPDATGRVVVR